MNYQYERMLYIISTDGTCDDECDGCPLLQDCSAIGIFNVPLHEKLSLANAWMIQYLLKKVRHES